MASSLWTISVAGGPYVTLSSLGIRSPVINLAGLDVGTLTFTVPVADIAAAAPFAYGQSVSIKRAAVVFFVGRVRAVAAAFSGPSSHWAVTVADTWWELERTVYRQYAVVWNALGSAKIGLMTTRVTLNQDAWSRQISQALQLSYALGYAAAMNPGILAAGASGLTGLWPKEESRDITVAEVVRRAASLSPERYPIIDYSAGLWTLNWAARGALTLATLDLAAADLVLDVSGLRARSDAVPPGVVLDFFSNDEDVDGLSRVRYTRQFAGVPGPAGTIYASLNLGPCDTAPAGAAAAYYAALFTAHYEGTLLLLEQECTGTIKPGSRLRLTNGQAAWATMDAVVLRTAYDLDAGLTTVEVGPPEALGIEDFISQLNRFRNRPASNGYCVAQQNGTAGVDPTSGVPAAVDDSDAPLTPDSNDPSKPPGRAPDVPPGSEAPNPESGTPPPSIYSYITVRYCDITVPAAPVTRYARVLGVPISAP